MFSRLFNGDTNEMNCLRGHEICEVADLNYCHCVRMKIDQQIHFFGVIYELTPRKPWMPYTATSSLLETIDSASPL